MVPNITRGYSFKGLTRYLINPKPGQRDRSERVGFIDLENFLPGEARTPEEAAHVMALTWKFADRLKAEAGIASTGKKATKGPVWHCTLSWTKGEKVTDDEMRQASREMREAIGLSPEDGYHALTTRHLDTDHPHCHIEVNLVHPITGRQANPYNDRVRAQRWANNYDRARGNVFCPQRAAKYRALENGLQLKSAWAKATSGTKDRAELAARKLSKYGQRVRDEAAAIRTIYAEKVMAISAENRAQFEDRREAKETLWQTYQQQRQAIKDRYQANIRDYYLHRRYKEVRAMRPKGPTNLKQTPEWRGLNRRLRTEKAEFFKRDIAPMGWDKGRRAWVFNEAANDNQRPLALREKVARNVITENHHRRNHANPHRVQMNAELAELAAAFKTEGQRLKVRDANEKLQARARWRELSAERAEAWQTFRDKFSLADKMQGKPAPAPEKDARQAARQILQEDFSSARDREPDLDDARRILWDQKADQFRENATDIDEAKRLVGELLSDEPTASTPSAEPPKEHHEQGWKRRGKDRAPRAPRNRRGGLDR